MPASTDGAADSHWTPWPGSGRNSVGKPATASAARPARTRSRRRDQSAHHRSLRRQTRARAVLRNERQVPDRGRPGDGHGRWVQRHREAARTVPAPSEISPYASSRVKCGPGRYRRGTVPAPAAAPPASRTQPLGRVGGHVEARARPPGRPSSWACGNGCDGSAATARRWSATASSTRPSPASASRDAHVGLGARAQAGGAPVSRECPLVEVARDPRAVWRRRRREPHERVRLTRPRRRERPDGRARAAGTSRGLSRGRRTRSVGFRAAPWSTGTGRAASPASDRRGTRGAPALPRRRCCGRPARCPRPRAAGG